MARHRSARHSKKHDLKQQPDTPLRIIGGRFRGRHLQYLTREDTRPMKHRVREAVFNLVGMETQGKHAIDLFAGTGAVGLEALSRGALGATFVEQHVPTALVIRENVESLGVSQLVDIRTTNVFLWAERDLPQLGSAASGAAKAPADPAAVPTTGTGPSAGTPPWMVFCCPPYELYGTRKDEMLHLVGQLLRQAPPQSVLVVEADARLDFDLLPSRTTTSRGENAPPWDVRSYPPAVVGVLRV